MCYSWRYHPAKFAKMGAPATAATKTGTNEGTRNPPPEGKGAGESSLNGTQGNWKGG